MTTALPVDSSDVSAVDRAARWPLLVLLCAAIKWLVIAGVLALISSIQLHSPAFLGDCAWFTHGRMVAMAESAFVYGWAANAGLALSLWILGRLGGEPLRALNWTVVGAYAWNIGLLLGLIGIAAGDATSFPMMQLPHYVQPAMLIAAGAMAVPGVLAWFDRRAESAFAAQWYAVAPLFLFPWLFSAAQLMLVWAPVRGTLQAVVATWFAQGVWSLWLAPMALAAAYFVVAKVTGRVLPAYRLFAAIGFWVLIFAGTWTGGRYLAGGPVPAWIPTIAVAAAMLVVFHSIAVLVNLRHAFGPGGTALRFIALGLAAYALAGVMDVVVGFRTVAKVTQFTHFITAQEQLALYGGLSMLLLGGVYFAIPRITGRPWASPTFVVGHQIALVLGVLGLVCSLGMAGWVQGHDLNDSNVSFATIAEHTRPWLLAATGAQWLLLAGNLLLLVNFIRSMCASCECCCESSLEGAAGKEASAS